MPINVTQLRSGEDPELRNTLKNASYREGWAAKCFKYSPTKGDGGVWAIRSSQAKQIIVEENKHASTITSGRSDLRKPPSL